MVSSGGVGVECWRELEAGRADGVDDLRVGPRPSLYPNFNERGSGDSPKTCAVSAHAVADPWVSSGMF